MCLRRTCANATNWCRNGACCFGTEASSPCKVGTVGEGTRWKLTHVTTRMPAKTRPDVLMPNEMLAAAVKMDRPVMPRKAWALLGRG